MPPTIARPILVTYSARDTGIVRLAHEVREPVAGVGNIQMAISTLPLCRRASTLSPAEAIAIARGYVICSRVLWGGMTCSECAGIMASWPELRDDAHLDLVRPDLRRQVFA
jgi:hypothetical protein